MFIRLSILLEYDQINEDRKIERALECAYHEDKTIVTTGDGEGFFGKIRSVHVQRGTSRDLETTKGKKVPGGDAAAKIGVSVPKTSVSKSSVQKRQRRNI